MSKLRPIFPRWQGSIRLVWKQYCFGRTCWSVEMLQWFAVLDFVLILSRIQISQMSWSRVTEDSKNNKNGDILNDLVKQLWSFFFHTQFNFPWELFHFESGLLTFLKKAVLWKDFLYNMNLKNLGIICCAQQTMRKGGLHWVLSFLLVFFFLEDDIVSPSTGYSLIKWDVLWFGETWNGLISKMRESNWTSMMIIL